MELQGTREPLIGDNTNQYHAFALDSNSGVDYAMDGNTTQFTALQDSSTIVELGVTIPINRLLVGFVGNSNGSVTVWVNGSSTNVASIYDAATTLTWAYLLSDGANPSQAAFKDVLIYNAALTSANVSTLFSYAQTRGVAASYAANLMCDGDSLTYGYGSRANRSYPSQLGLSSSIQVWNLGLAGQTMASMVTVAATLVDPNFVSGQTNVLVIWGGTNDLFGGTAPATVYADLSSYISARCSAGWNKIAVLTCLPRTGDNETNRATYNSLITANTAGADVVVDVASNSDLSNDTNGTYFYTDDTHLTAAGYAIVAGMVSSAIDGYFGGSTTATGAATLGALVAAGTGSFLTIGTGAATWAALAAAGVGSFTAAATGAATWAALVAAGSGSFSASATGAATWTALAAAGIGTGSSPPSASGTGAATWAALSASGSGSFTATATGAATWTALAAAGAAVALTPTGTNAVGSAALRARGARDRRILDYGHRIGDVGGTHRGRRGHGGRQSRDYSHRRGGAGIAHHGRARHVHRRCHRRGHLGSIDSAGLQRVAGTVSALRIHLRADRDRQRLHA